MTIASSSPSPRSRTGSRAREKKAHDQSEGTYLDDALQHFSGYIAIDELYEGKKCVLCLVDSKAHRRLLVRVLDHSPTHKDIRQLLRDFRAHLEKRGLTLAGVTTDGSSLYPVPLAEVFPSVPHQVCVFHVLKEINEEVLHILSSARKEARAQLPRLPRGRPSREKNPLVQEVLRKRKKLRDLFEGRFLFVKKKLTKKERRELRKLCKGNDELKALRGVVEEVHRLFDRRCRTETAREKLTQLRKRLEKYPKLQEKLGKLNSPTLEKALTFLDDKLLEATSNAPERANRRHRKMQNSIYRTRSLVQLRRRIALDMLREARAQNRGAATKALHHVRAHGGPPL